MGKEDARRGKVTPENTAEAARLRELWDTRPHPSQAVFGETYGIGNQSAVGQFLRGDVPLSLKAARGFAQGLGCLIEDFSPRLAAEAAAIASMVPGEPLRREVAELASAVNVLPAAQRDWVLSVLQSTVDAARASIQVTPPDVAQKDEHQESLHDKPSSRRTSSG